MHSTQHVRIAHYPLWGLDARDLTADLHIEKLDAMILVLVQDRGLAFENVTPLARLQQALEKLPEGDIKVDDPRVSLPPKDKVYSDIAALISHFKLIQEGIKPPAGEIYQAIEAPKGELGFYLVSDGTGQPFRVKIRAPSFVVLNSTNRLATGRLLADLIAIIGTMDIVLADVDR